MRAFFVAAIAGLMFSPAQAGAQDTPPAGASQPPSANGPDLNDLLGPAPAAPAQPAPPASQSAPAPAAPASAPEAAPAPAASTPAASTPPPDAGEASKDNLPAETKPQPAEAARPAKNRMIEEIVVTAEKREESIEKVPISIQAFSGAQLDAKGIEDPSKLALVTPGFTYTTVSGYTLIYIRGVGTDAFIPSADASVATYIDGIYYPFGFGLASALGDVERVEVLKGPQGTLFGRNADAGAISIITKQPDFGGDITAHVLAARESFGTTKVRMSTNIPLNDHAAISISGLRYEGDDFYRLSSGPYHPSSVQPPEISQGFNAKLGLKPWDDLKVVLNYTMLNFRGTYMNLLPAGNGPGDIFPLGKLLGVAACPDYVDCENAPTFVNQYTRTASVDLKYHLKWFDTRFLGAMEHIGPSDARPDYDGSSAPLVSFETVGQFGRTRTAELQFLSNDSAPEWLKLLGGVFYINSTAGYRPLDLYVGNGLIPFLENPTIFPGSPLAGLGNITLPLITTLENVPGLGNILTTLSNQNNQTGLITASLNGVIGTYSISGFFQGTADLTDRLSLTLGMRYQTEHRALLESNFGVLNPLNLNQFIQIFNFANPVKNANTNNLSPKAVLDYKINDDVHAYGSYSVGYKSGTYNIIAVYLPPSYVVPERVTAYELGLKGTMLDQSLKLNAAVFENQIKNLQTSFVSLLGGGVTEFETAPAARSIGTDFDFNWNVLPETLPGFVLTGGLAWLNSRYTNYPNGSGFDDTSGLFYSGSGLVVGGGVLPGRSFTGNHIVRTPALSGDISPSYAFGVGSNGQVELSVDWSFKSGFYFASSNSPLTYQEPYRILGAQASYSYEPWKMRVTAYGENLTNEKYYNTIQQFDFDTAKKLAAPRIVGVRLAWDY